jgi:hypothetical protein
MWGFTSASAEYEVVRDEFRCSTSWSDFWEEQVGGKNNLPRFKGKPEAVVLLRGGNDTITVAQRGTTFYVINCRTG